MKLTLIIIPSCYFLKNMNYKHVLKNEKNERNFMFILLDKFINVYFLIVCIFFKDVKDSKIFSVSDLKVSVLHAIRLILRVFSQTEKIRSILRAKRILYFIYLINTF